MSRFIFPSLVVLALIFQINGCHCTECATHLSLSIYSGNCIQLVPQVFTFLISPTNGNCQTFLVPVEGTTQSFAFSFYNALGTYQGSTCYSLYSVGCNDPNAAKTSISNPDDCQNRQGFGFLLEFDKHTITTSTRSSLTTTIPQGPNQTPSQTAAAGGGGGGPDAPNLPDQERKPMKCFSSDSVVRVLQPNLEVISLPLSELRVGQMVESVDEHMERTFSKVYYIAHESSKSSTVPLLALSFANPQDQTKSIKLAYNHLLFASFSQEADMHLVQAGEVSAGDWILILHNQTVVRSQVKSILPMTSAVRHPLTENHRIVVDDVVASVHAFDDALYTAITLPLRVAAQLMPSLLHSTAGQIVMDAIVSGTDLIEEFLVGNP